MEWPYYVVIRTGSESRDPIGPLGPIRDDNDWDVESGADLTADNDGFVMWQGSVDEDDIGLANERGTQGVGRYPMRLGATPLQCRNQFSGLVVVPVHDE
jgi:hypothetical protein